MAVLYELLAGEEPLILVTSATGLTPRLCPPEHLVDNSLVIEPGQELGRDRLAETLVAGGYGPVSLVEQVGDFALRGSVVDFFGPLWDDPIRVEFFGDTVESLRAFDPLDQRSQTPLNSATLIPCHPVEISQPAAERAVKSLRALADREGMSARRLAQVIELIEQRLPFTGLEHYLPLYYPAAADLFAYLPEDCRHLIIEPAEVNKRLESEEAELAARYDLAKEEGRVALTPPMLRRTAQQTVHRLESKPRLLCRALALAGTDLDDLPLVTLSAGTHQGLYQELSRRQDGSLLSAFLQWQQEQEENGRRVALVCRSKSQVTRLGDLLAEREHPAGQAESPAELSMAPGGETLPLWLLVGGLTAGFTPEDLPVTFVTEDEVFGAPRVVRHKAPPSLSAMLAAMDDLAPGDTVVHVDHGIGRYQGLITLPVGAAESDFLELIYKGGDKLYLPADRMGLISKYRGPGEGSPELDRLGGLNWQRTKKRVQKAIDAIARDLVELYAARRFLKGQALPPPDSVFREFEAGFPYTETDDQAKAIEQVVGDLTAAKPMDRLVCGDVGYGKTEVALRACFLVAMTGRQVAFLVPTTVLAEQHYQTFVERLADWPIEVDSLSRFKSPAQQKQVVEKLADGELDIVIGTHRLLQKDVKFKDLGLVVIDEEHRFGVRHKERLKEMRRLVDVLALTATPIPRTLQMSLSGLRDLSVINTPPADRQAIKTYLAVFKPQAVAESINRELARGGQVFFVHNRVADIGKMARLVQRLAPNARLGVAHGQMSEKALEKVMMAFVKREIDVLVCTTIIESGLDIPSANTIIITEAERLGLSQIYQLRGRVGRSGQRAYAYLFVKSEEDLSRQAQRRLKALMDFTRLGAGFAIAMHDLQIRGAGNLLGEVQSGQVAEVGYELYVRMLEETVARMKGEAPPEGPEPELNLKLAASLPEDYVPDPQVRLGLYRRLSQAGEESEAENIAAELIDRFGPLPDSALNLVQAVGLKNRLRALRGRRLDLAPGAVQLYFDHDSRIQLERLLALARDPASGVKVYPDGRVSLKLGNDQEPVAAAREFLQSIGDSGI
jgi:transcription-repair coupling factor (superfamily II helicase)